MKSFRQDATHGKVDTHDELEPVPPRTQRPCWRGTLRCGGPRLPGSRIRHLEATLQERFVEISFHRMQTSLHGKGYRDCSEQPPCGGVCGEVSEQSPNLIYRGCFGIAGAVQGGAASPASLGGVAKVGG